MEVPLFNPSTRHRRSPRSADAAASARDEHLMHLTRLLASSVSVCALIVAMSPAAESATITVPAGGNLQTALNSAQPGDTILLQAGATFVGNFTLPLKSGTAYITVRSSALDSSLPAANVRIDPRYASLLPKLRSPNTASALATAAGAHHWRLQFLEFQANSGGAGEIIRLGSGSELNAASQARHLVLDRVYIHGDPKLGSKRGIALNSGDTTIVNSYISDIKSVGQDSQAICGWNGPGPYRIENNYLEAAAENVMFGGANPTIANLVPANITIRRNHFSKNLAWRNPVVSTPAATAAAGAGGSLPAGTYAYRVVAYAPCGNNQTCRSTASPEVKATVGTGGTVTVKWAAISGATSYRVYGRAAGAENQYWTATTTSLVDGGAAGTASAVPTSAGTRYVVKNLLEVKNGRLLLIEGNVFEYSWAQDQKGYAILFTPANSGSAPWTAVQDITFQYNTVRHVGAGMQIMGRDTTRGSEYSKNILVRHNLFDDVSTAWGGPAGFLATGHGAQDVTIDHNTIVHSGFVMAATGESNPGFVFTNNMTRHNQWGIYGDGGGAGFSSINVYFIGLEMRRNVMAGGSASKYPADNFFPPTADFLVQFVNPAAGDYRLTTASPYRAAATDGTAVGVNMTALQTAQRGS